ncbi:MAG TPA: hypothetical protein VFR36_07950 [Sphingomicrobium sp.]|nr:hypothetical protein [Sphingomicrobium sp.]
MPAIQPCALLLLVGPDWQVEAVSANVAMLGDHRSADLVGQPLADLIGTKAIHALRNRLAWLSGDESEVRDFGVQWGDVTLDLRAICEHGTYLIEAELAVEPRLPDGIGMVRSMSDRLSGSGPAELAAQAMRQLTALTGFESVMLCNARGMVIAANEQADSSAPMDCSITRLIADRDAEPVPIIGSDGHGLLSRAAFLAPTEEQVAQLASSGIAATMSLPLRIDGDRVGTLHACHTSPRRIGAERRSVTHLFSERLVARMARLGWKP